MALPIPDKHEKKKHKTEPHKVEAPPPPPAPESAIEECKQSHHFHIPSLDPPPHTAYSVPNVPSEPTILSVEKEQLAEEKNALKGKLPKKRKKELQAHAKLLQSEVKEIEAFVSQMNNIEDQHDPNLYTQANYDAVIAKAKLYTDAFVSEWKGPWPRGGAQGLREKLHAIVEGAAGMETGWSPEIVKGAANRRPHNGVFQAEWAFINEARRVIYAKDEKTEKGKTTYPDHHPAMKALLEEDTEDKKGKNPKDKKASSSKDKRVLDLSLQIDTASGMPTPSFAGQGVSYAAMVVSSFEHFISEGGKPDDFNGKVAYEDHLLGPKGGSRFRRQLAADLTIPGTSGTPGKPGITREAYNENFLIFSDPFAQLDDLNPQRIIYKAARAVDVDAMLTNKFIHERNRMVKHNAPADKIAAFEQAFLPDWSNNPKKRGDDIAHITSQKEEGAHLRAEAMKQMQIDRLIHERNKMVEKKMSQIKITLFELAHFPEWLTDSKRKEQDIARVKELYAHGEIFEQKEVACNILRPMKSGPGPLQH